MKRGSTTVYFELDLADNVRRLRGPNGFDLGGYRYTAFGQTADNTADVDQPLRWKARWHQDFGGHEVYDVRARQWSPELGAFLSIDEFEYQDANSTLWGWPNQNTVKYSDPSGRTWYDPNTWSDSTQQYFLTGQAERDTIAAFVSIEMALATAGLSTEVQLAGLGVRGAIAAGVIGGGLNAAESDLIRSGGQCVSPTNVAIGAVTGGITAGANAWLKPKISLPSSGAHSRNLGFTNKNLQKGFTKHGSDFGLKGNWNPNRASDFSRAINQHVNDPSVIAIEGTYRDTINVVHYYNPATGVNVIADESGNYITGFNLGDTQLEDLLFQGNVW